MFDSDEKMGAFFSYEKCEKISGQVFEEAEILKDLLSRIRDLQNKKINMDSFRTVFIGKFSNYLPDSSPTRPPAVHQSAPEHHEHHEHPNSHKSPVHSQIHENKGQENPNEEEEKELPHPIQPPKDQASPRGNSEDHAHSHISPKGSKATEFSKAGSNLGSGMKPRVVQSSLGNEKPDQSHRSNSHQRDSNLSSVSNSSNREELINSLFGPGSMAGPKVSGNRSSHSKNHGKGPKVVYNINETKVTMEHAPLNEEEVKALRVENQNLKTRIEDLGMDLKAKRRRKQKNQRRKQKGRRKNQNASFGAGKSQPNAARPKQEKGRST